MNCEFLKNKKCQIASQLAKVDAFPTEVECELCSKCKRPKSENSITLGLAINYRFKNNLPKDKNLIEGLINIRDMERYAISQKSQLSEKNNQDHWAAAYQLDVASQLDIIKELATVSKLEGRAVNLYVVDVAKENNQELDTSEDENSFQFDLE